MQADTVTPMARTDTPTEAAAQQRPADQRPIRVRALNSAGIWTFVASAVGASGLAWLLYERILPLTGALGFWIVWYLAFLGLYATAGALQWPKAVVVDKTVAVLLSTAVVMVILVVLDQVVFTTFRGGKALRHDNFFRQTMAYAGPLDPLTVGGILHALVGSLEQLALASLFAVPLGLAAALFLVEVGGLLARPVRTIVEAMTALPEIVAGLFVYAFVILALGVGKSGFAASMALTVMMIPVVTRAGEVIFRLVPAGLRDASYALGASQVRTVWNVVLPTARSGLSTAVILAMARAVGETSPVLLTAGFTKELNADPFSGPQTSLPLYIFNYVRYPQQAMVSRAFGAGLVLMIMVLVLFAIARLLGGKAPGEFTRRQRRAVARAARHGGVE